MTVYYLLAGYILLGQMLVSSKAISKKFYCITVCICFVLISGLRDINVGMWDTKTIYLPSFRVIEKYTISKILKLNDTQFKFIGYVLYSKLILLISNNENFYIFMTAWPFFVAVGWLIYKWSSKPGYSFVALLGYGFLTYSFSMIRGMLALAFCTIAVDAALEKKWKKFLIYVSIGTTFHVTALLTMLVYPITKINWTSFKILVILVLTFVTYYYLPIFWEYFVSTYIKKILPTYNYYGYKGGEMAYGMMVLYLVVLLIIPIKNLIFNKGKIILKISKNKAIPTNYVENVLLGMSAAGCVLIVFTSFISEALRMAMFFAIGNILIIGENQYPINNMNNRKILLVYKLSCVAIMVLYFFLSAIPNMNATNYKFFW